MTESTLTSQHVAVLIPPFRTGCEEASQRSVSRKLFPSGETQKGNFVLKRCLEEIPSECEIMLRSLHSQCGGMITANSLSPNMWEYEYYFKIDVGKKREPVL